MKLRYTVGLLVMLIPLSAWAGHYDCSSIDVLDQLAEEHLVKADEAFQRSWGIAVTESVSYEFNAIGMLAHNKSTNNYQCSTNFKTSTADGRTWEQKLEYYVYPIDDPDSDFEVGYNSTRLLATLNFAIEYRNWKLSELIRREAEKVYLLGELDRFRSDGDWSGEAEIASGLVRMGEVVPRRTPAQQVTFGSERFGRFMESQVGSYNRLMNFVRSKLERSVICKKARGRGKDQGI